MTLPVILPLKYINYSKSRLNEVLGENKINLVIALLEDMVSLLQKYPDVEIYLLTKKENMDILPRELSVKYIFEDEKDLNGALEKGIKFLKEKSDKVLILPLDLPFINETDVQNLISLSRDVDGAVSPSSRDGTSALLIPVERFFKIQFGEKSFERHIHEFEENDIPFKIYNSDTLFYDLDTPEDVMRVLVVRPDTKAHSLLKDIIPANDNYSILIGK